MPNVPSVLSCAFIILAGLAAAAIQASPSQAVPFSSRHMIDVENGAESPLLADLDGDGDTDLISIPDGRDRVLWYENLGQQGFGPANILGDENTGLGQPGGEVKQALAGDMDGDGDLDVVCRVGIGFYTVCWFENINGGGFGSPRFVVPVDTTYLSSGTTPPDVDRLSIADVDGDGDLDLLALGMSHGPYDSWIGAARWYENLGSGVFAAPRLVADWVWSDAWPDFADLDGDGDVDLLLVNGRDSGLAWYENLGGGTFSTRRVINTDSALKGRAADIDGDGLADVLWFTSTELRLSLNLGGGAFGPPHLIADSLAPVYWHAPIHVEDVDRDGDLDVLWGSSTTGPLEITWHENIGGGAFGQQHLIAQLSTGGIIGQVSDIDGDGDIDALVQSSGVGWFENLSVIDCNQNGVHDPDELALGLGHDCNANGILDECEAMQGPDCNGNGVPDACDAASGLDCNGNGRPDACDVAEGLDCDGNGVPDTCDIMNDPALDLDGDGQLDGCPRGGFGDPQPIAQMLCGQGYASDVLTADLDGDGDQDVLHSCSYVGVFWSENLGQGVFGPDQPLSEQADPPNSEVSALHVTDLDEDGDIDVMWTRNDWSPIDKVVWAENLGSGEFHAPRLLTQHVQDYFTILSADLDGDQSDDLIVRDDRGLAWHRNRADGTLGPRRRVSNGDDAEALDAADLDGDGDLDLVATLFWWKTVSWYPNLGNGTFGPVRHLTYDADRAFSARATDLDGDGDADLLAALRNPYRVVWFENFGEGRFGPELSIGAGDLRVHRAFAGDLDSDGDLDVIGASQASGQLVWHGNLGGGAHGFFADAQPIETNGSPQVPVDLADMDGDGDMDILSMSGSWGTGNPDLTWIENLAPPHDCNGNGIIDSIDLGSGASADCDGNGVPDECDLARTLASDWDGDGVLDACLNPHAVFCIGNLNATGVTGKLRPLGSPLIAQDDFTLYGYDLPPDQPVLGIMSRSTGYVNPFGGGEGALCLGSPIRRFDLASGFPVQVTSSTGDVSLSPSIGQLPGPHVVMPGEVIYFQLWHREVDPATGALRSNTTDGISVMFR